MSYIYLIQNEIDKFYTGSTNDLRRRLTDHNNSKVYSTRGHRWRLIYYEAYLAEADAREREHQLKFHGQALYRLKKRLKNSLQNKNNKR